MNLITLDFETAYSESYTLSKMSLEDYVTDSRFQVLGVGIKRNDEGTVWHDAREPRDATYFKALFAEICDSALLCQNTMFDGLILAHHYNIYPKFYFDTMLMARPTIRPYTGSTSLSVLARHLGLGTKGTELESTLGKWLGDFTDESLSALGKYCVNDVELTYKVFKYLLNAHNADLVIDGLVIPPFPKSELVAIDQTLRMYLQPQLELDAVVLAEAIHQERQERDTELQNVIANTCVQNQTQLLSNPQLAELLISLGVTPPTKISLTTSKQTYAFAKTDADFIRLLDHPNGEVRQIVKARLRLKSNIDIRRAEQLQIIANNHDKLRVQLHYYGAHTGRYAGGGGVNLQNLRRGSPLRKAMIAPTGCVLLAGDLSQVEARVTAWLAGQYDLLEIFADPDRDVYCEFATIIFGKTITKEHTRERFVGKTCILGLGYGMGAEKLRGTLANGGVEVSQTEAVNYVNAYRNTYRKIKAMWYDFNDVIEHMAKPGNIKLEVHRGNGLSAVRERLYLPNGLPLTYPGLILTLGIGGRLLPEVTFTARNSAGAPYDKKIYGGKLVENVVQALAQIIIKYHMAEIGKKYQIALQVHDEIIVCVPKHEITEAQGYMTEVMSKPPSWAEGLPIACETAYGDNYYECKA